MRRDRFYWTIGFAIGLWLCSMIWGCAGRPKMRSAECHVLSVDQITERHDEGAATEKWLAWCGEGRYVVFQSSVTAGEFVRFTEYQEDDRLQIHGAIEEKK